MPLKGVISHRLKTSKLNQKKIRKKIQHYFNETYEVIFSRPFTDSTLEITLRRSSINQARCQYTNLAERESSHSTSVV